MTPEELLKKHAIDFHNWTMDNEYWESTTRGKWGRLANMENFWDTNAVYEMFIRRCEIPPNYFEHQQN